ncbi:MAG: sigma-70 family RNA polymerase sigma factor [Planctomycetota bacterium]
MPSLTHRNSPLAQARRSRSADAPVAAATTQTVSHTPDKTPNRPAAGRRSRAALRPAERDTLRRLLTEKYEYVDHELFALPEDESYHKVFVEPDLLPLPDVSWYHQLMDPTTPGSADAAAFVKNPKGSVLLTAAQERVLFSQFNYCRRQVCLRRDQLLSTPDADGGKPLTRHQKSRVERELLDWYVRADTLRKQIADTNLALVLAMAKRTRIYPGDFADLVSEGNMALLRAADKFDVGRGFKFSTYACRAILKAFSRQGIKLSKHRQMFPMDFDPKLERSNYQSEKNAAHEDDCADEVRRIVADNRAELSDVERTVVAARFNVGPGALPTPVIDKPVFRLDAAVEVKPRKTDGFELPEPLRGRTSDAKPLTLEQVGKLIGVTKERVRQIQNKALKKIRLTLEEDYLA